MVESVHTAHAAVVRDGELVGAVGDAGLVTFMRSAAKPFQALALAEEEPGLPPEELAIACASHEATPEQLRLVASLLARAGAREDELACGEEHGSKSGHNCSGKHAGMLAHCRHRGWPTFDYRDAGHPLQREILDVVARMSGEPPGAVALGVDGCGVPAFHLSLKGMATAYARLWRGDEAGGWEALPVGWAGAAREIVEAMAAEPWMTAGTGRTCTRVSEASAGRVVPKVGAAGIFCAVLRDRGLGLALKVEDGSSRAASAALVESLRQLDTLSDAALARLEGAAPGVVRNHAGTAVGECRARFHLARPGSS